MARRDLHAAPSLTCTVTGSSAPFYNSYPPECVYWVAPGPLDLRRPRLRRPHTKTPLSSASSTCRRSSSCRSSATQRTDPRPSSSPKDHRQSSSRCRRRRPSSTSSAGRTSGARGRGRLGGPFEPAGRLTGGLSTWAESVDELGGGRGCCRDLSVPDKGGRFCPANGTSRDFRTA